VGAWGRPDDIVVTSGIKTEAKKEALDNLDIDLTSGPYPLTDAVARVDGDVHMSDSLYKLGQMAEWSDPAFDDSHGSTGFWKPMTFLKDQGIGIYFMNAYDSQRIPILFVHGAGGTPRAWQEMANNLDLDRFQPWVFYYPSGLRLDQIATTLNYMVRRLQTDYGFDRMGVVAHSMGGLVSRSFIMKHLIEDGLKTVRVFVSISTPWGGVHMAKEGVENAPAAIPSWHDVAPGSDFIHQIFEDPLRPEVPHFLIFGYRSKCSLFMANNDGTVEVASQLDMRAQKDAMALWGLDEDHMSILTSEDAISFLNQAIAAGFSEESQ
jgi:pimeloyl-ACP methyl ester carboxylesterase